jgi:UDP-N-acetylmuramoyl-tripeptide--D-alanyl-D-alanine ligase
MNTDAPIFTPAQVLDATGGELISGRVDRPFEGVSTDSRQIKPGNLFVALTGDNFDGHHFIGLALDGGATGVVVQNTNTLDLKKIHEGACVVIRVTDTLTAMGDLAHAFRMRFAIPVIGLTGSSGKTTTKEMLACILEMEKKVLKTQGNLNNLIGLPQTIFRLTHQHDIAILEMGTNMRGEIKRLTKIASPDIGLITNVGPAHLAGLGSVEMVREEKGDLFCHLNPSGTAVVNLDDEAVRMAAERWSGKRVTFSMTASADVGVIDIRKNGARGVSFNLMVREQIHKVEMKVAGIHNIYNAMAAAATAMAVGCRVESISKGLASFEPVRGRMEIIKLQNGAYVINDAYNANPASVREALLTLKDLKGAHHAFVFLGDMLELGEAAEEFHRKIGILLATTGVTSVFLQGDFAEITAAGALEGGLAKSQVMLLKDDDEAMASLKKQLRKGDWILVKGSRRMKMDRIVARVSVDFGEINGEASRAAH